VYRRNPRADAERVSQVLAGMAYPAAKWQLIMQAEEYGADAPTRAELWALPTGSYPDLPAVLAALGFEGAPVERLAKYRTQPSPNQPYRTGPYRAQPAPQVAGRVRPLR
jgi:hypothetical protein